MFSDPYCSCIPIAGQWKPVGKHLTNPSAPYAAQRQTFFGFTCLLQQHLKPLHGRELNKQPIHGSGLPTPPEELGLLATLRPADHMQLRLAHMCQGEGRILSKSTTCNSKRKSICFCISFTSPRLQTYLLVSLSAFQGRGNGGNPQKLSFLAYSSSYCLPLSCPHWDWWERQLNKHNTRKVIEAELLL